MELSSQSTWVLQKTSKGHEELQSRTYHLSPSLRGLLILANGQRSIAELLTTSRDAVRSEEAVSQLLRDGFVQADAPGATLAAAATPAVEPTTLETQHSPKDRLLKLVNDMFGIQPKLAQKLTASGDSTQELEAAIQACAKYISLFIDDTQASAFRLRANSLIAH